MNTNFIQGTTPNEQICPLSGKCQMTGTVVQLGKLSQTFLWKYLALIKIGPGDVSLKIASFDKSNQASNIDDFYHRRPARGRVGGPGEICRADVLLRRLQQVVSICVLAVARFPNPLSPGSDIQIHVSWGTRLISCGNLKQALHDISVRLQYLYFKRSSHIIHNTLYIYSCFIRFSFRRDYDV